MKGQFDLPTTTLFKLLQIGIVVVGILAIFFSYMQYNIFVDARESEREALLIGNSLLSSDCLTYADVRSLFSEEKLNNIESDVSCLKEQYPYGAVKIEFRDLTKEWKFEIAYYNLGGEANFNLVIKTLTGEIKPALMTVRV